MRCITPLKLKILKILNFSTIISIENCRPLATKLRDLKMFKMAFQVVFSAKNVPRFSFGLLVAPKLKNEGGHNGPPLGHNVFPELGSNRINHGLWEIW